MADIDLVDIYNQLLASIAKRQFVFNLMLVGEPGCGKTTLVNTLFRRDQLESYDSEVDENCNVGLVETTHLLEENGIKLRLRCIESRGFGAGLNNENCWQPLVDYIDEKYREYVNDEFRGPRACIQDNRVHCCLYFIPPTGRPLRQIDIDCLKALHNKVNILPVIAKADSLTPDDCQRFKQLISRELERHSIKTYQFPEEKEEDGDEDEDSCRASEINRMKDCSPFAVVGSNYVEKRNGDIHRVRKYHWGTVDVDDPRHCDLLALSKLMIRFYMVDLIDSTNCVHYSNYRNENLEKTPDELLA